MGTTNKSWLATNAHVARQLSSYSGISTLTKVDLTTAFVPNVSGIGFGITFIPPDAGNLTDLWISPDSFLGDWSLTDGAINYSIHDGANASINYSASTTILNSGTIPLTTGDAGAWVRKSGLSVALEADKMYFIMIGDADGNATNYVKMNRDIRQGQTLTPVHANALTTSTGFSTQGGLAGYPPVFAVRVGGVTYCGATWKGSVVPAGSTLKKGLRIKIPAGYPPVALTCVGIGSRLFYGGLHLYRGESAIPNDTPVWSQAFNELSGANSHNWPVRTIPTDNLPVLLGGETYYLVRYYTTNVNSPQKITTFSNVDDELRQGLHSFDRIEFAYAIEVTGGASWDVDINGTPDLYPQFAPANVTRAAAFIA